MFVFIVIYLKVVIIIASTIIYVTKSAQFSQWFLFFFLFIHYKKSSLHFVQKWRIISNEYDISVSLKKKNLLKLEQDFNIHKYKKGV